MSKVDTINVNEGAEGHHPEQARRILMQERRKDNLNAAMYDQMEPKEKTAFNKKAARSVK